jgi:excisionase family DNA binding protein
VKRYELEQRITITVPEAGKILGIGRAQSYAAAREGKIPTLQLGRRLLVPVKPFLDMIDGVIAMPTPDG